MNELKDIGQRIILFMFGGIFFILGLSILGTVPFIGFEYLMIEYLLSIASMVFGVILMTMGW